MMFSWWQPTEDSTAGCHGDSSPKSLNAELNCLQRPLWCKVDKSDRKIWWTFYCNQILNQNSNSHLCCVPWNWRSIISSKKKIIILLKKHFYQKKKKKCSSFVENRALLICIKCMHTYIRILFLCKCWKMEYQMSKQLLDACAALGMEYNWVEKGLQRTAGWFLFPNSQITTVRLVIRRPLSAGAFFLWVYVWECFPHSKNIKIRSSANLWQTRAKRKHVFSNNWSDSASSRNQCTSEWH